MELNSDVNITLKENVRKIWQFMFAGYADFLQKNKVHPTHIYRGLEINSDSGLMELHIRKEHMGETEAKAPTRGPSAAPNSWFISEELIGRASQIEKHRFVRSTTFIFVKLISEI